MCGIVGILGRHEVAPLILEALKRLEYRGYDSAGIATLHDGRLGRRRAVGKLIALSDLLVQDPIRGHAGIGHTRWATHGAPSERNAHPHQAGRRRGRAQRHHRELPRACAPSSRPTGAVFETETDTETVVQLCNRELAPRQAAGRGGARDARAARRRLRALLPVRRRGRPAGRRPPRLAARDRLRRRRDLRRLRRAGARAAAPTASPTSRRATTRCSPARGVEIFDADGAPGRAARSTTCRVENVYAEKGPYKHFMAKEMHEQPHGDRRRARPLPRRPTATRVPLPAGIDFAGCRPAGARRLRHRALRLPRREVLVRGPRPPAGRDRGRLRVPLPRAAARPRHARHLRQPVGRDRRHARGAALRPRRRAAASSRWSTSRPRRSRARATWRCRSSPAPRSASPRPRPSPASSPCSPRWRSPPPAQRGRIDAAEEARLAAALGRRARPARPGAGARAARSPRSPATSPAPATCSSSAAAPMYPLALEGALKLKEISYIHAEGYASGELKHGPIALIDEEVPVIVLAPSDALFDKTVSNMQEVMARDGKVLLITDAEGLAQRRRRRLARAARCRRRPVRRADRLRRAGAAARLPHRGAQGHRRRPAAQPREVRDGRVAAAHDKRRSHACN